ncbi:hypothetical protein [Streptomyces sp. CC210A]|uniref:hypothetical protein n=1 Tax=Streptomyces sp. CC210A TaxID=2898184 RepID=UPI001F1D9556|nr:hypothetical protein [Streptomyces sp. CC210A]
MRPRIRTTAWPRRALILTDTPRLDCPGCRGGHNHDYGDEHGEYAGTEWEPCPCWDEDRRWILLPLPYLSRRRRTSPDPWGGGYSNEPPF